MFFEVKSFTEHSAIVDVLDSATGEVRLAGLSVLVRYKEDRIFDENAFVLAIRLDYQRLVAEEERLLGPAREFYMATT